MASSPPNSPPASPLESPPPTSSSSAGTRSPTPPPGHRRRSSPSRSPSPPSKRVRASPAWSTLEAGGSSSRTCPAPQSGPGTSTSAPAPPSGPGTSSTAPAPPDPPLDNDDEIDPDVPRRVITSVSPSGKVAFYCPICGAMRDSNSAMAVHVIDRLRALPPSSDIKWSYRYLARREGYIVD